MNVLFTGGTGYSVSQLTASGREEHVLHSKVHRPWGWYGSVDDDLCFKIKRIQVKPKASLSPQKYYWVVVKGAAEITSGEKTILRTESQSTYIPLGEVHRLSNPGTISLGIAEVQSGGDLGEDDIGRFDGH